MNHYLTIIISLSVSLTFGQSPAKAVLKSVDNQKSRGASEYNDCYIVDADRADKQLMTVNKDSVAKIHAPFGIPIAESKDVVVLTNPTYIVGYDTVHKVPMWVSYKLLPGPRKKKFDRIDCFRYDPRLPVRVQASYNEYDQNPRDTLQRGHIKPSADADQDSLDGINTFIMTNMAPQHETFNEKEWLALEQFIRNHSQGKGITEAYMISGSVVDETCKKLNGKLTIPSAFYKIYYFKINGKWCYWTFYLNHDWTLQKFDDYKNDLLTKRKTIDEIELKTKINFLLAPTDGGKIESALDQTFDLTKLTKYPSF